MGEKEGEGMNDCEHPIVICHPVIIPLRGDLWYARMDVMRSCDHCGAWLDTKKGEEYDDDPTP